MNKQREALRIALDALEDYQTNGAPFFRCDSAVAAIREALAEPEQEPMATITGWYGGHPVIEPVDGWIPAVGTVLYSAPDNIEAAAPDLLKALEGLLDCAIHGFDMPDDNQFALNARAAIDRAHKIGEA